MDFQSLEQRLAKMEEETREQRAIDEQRYQQMSEMFTTLLQQTSVPEAPKPEVPINLGQRGETSPNSASTTNKGSSQHGVKASLPADFDGQRKGGQAFLNSCELYMHLANSRFSDDQQRIHWALTFCKTGRAARFADRILRYERTHNLAKYASWTVFVADFKVRFCENYEQVRALTQLEGDSWHQRNSSVDDYIDSFEELVDLAGLSTDAGLVMKFRRGLNKDIQDKVAEMETPPQLSDLEAWKEAARRFYQNVEANKAFIRQARPATTLTPSRGILPVRHNLSPRPLPAVPPRPNLFASFKAKPDFAEAPKSKLEGPIPMEVDSSRARSFPATCHRCHQPGHFAKECPTRYDVRAVIHTMTSEEKRDLLDQLLVEADIAQISSMEVRSETSPEIGAEQDFQNSSE